jgi:signal transduction histidine kinase
MTGCSADGASWAFGIAALLLVAAGGGGVGWLLARQRDGQALQQARQNSRLTLALAGGLVWQTDASHRLQAAGPWRAGSLVWDWFDAGDQAQQLRQVLEGRASLAPTPACQPGDDRLWELRAEPCYDGLGGFSGHLGLARPTDAAGPAATALGALVDARNEPMLVLLRRPADSVWRVLHANAAARLQVGDGTSLPQARLLAVLPAALHAALDGPAPEAAAEADRWQLLRRPLPPQELCLVWQHDGAGNDAVADEQASFSYTVSHDLRAPIRVVEGFTRIVKEDYGRVLDRVANDHLDRVLGAAARMNQMIDAMLTLARLSTQPLARQPVNLSQLAGYVVDDLRRSAPERDAEIVIEPGLQAQGDPTLLRLVLENLLGNAWKYTGRRSQARIEMARETIDGRAVFVVRDNGAGFDMRSAERLFGLFQRLHSANDFPGTGVGLASVRRIVQRHGGDIWADGEPGRGAAFHFTLRD